jgi:hypothetical protein
MVCRPLHPDDETDPYAFGTGLVSVSNGKNPISPRGVSTSQTPATARPLARLPVSCIELHSLHSLMDVLLDVADRCLKEVAGDRAEA